jgi:hypothetical protein
MLSKLTNKYRYTFFPLFTAIVLGMGSCKKLVDVGKPVSTITTEDAFTTNAKANSTVAGIYSQMMNNNGSMYFSNGGMTIYAGLSSDELTNFSGTVNPQDYQFYTNTLLATSPTPGSLFWTPAYKNIYNANAVMEGIAASTATGLGDSVRKELTGEAKFIRAFNYFYLTNLFGDVPMPLVTDFNQTSLLKRLPQADVYKQIVQDLTAAQSLLPGDYSVGGGERVRVNKWAATALLARVYLYQQDWANAETQANAIIANSQYSLAPVLTNVFNKNSTEAIWQLQQNNTYKPYNATWEGTNFIPTFRWSSLAASDQAGILLGFSIYAAYVIPPYYFSPGYINNFEPGDKRKTLWTDSTPSPAIAPYNGKVYYYPVKYTVQLGLTGGPITQYYMMLRLAEQYLIRAEARAQQGTNLSGAAADLNALRSRAGLANTTAANKTDLLTAVMHERQTELFAEWGHRWLDLKRTGKAGSVLGAIATKQPWSDNQLLYPIPLLDLTNDPNLVQNNGY